MGPTANLTFTGPGGRWGFDADFNARVGLALTNFAEGGNAVSGKYFVGVGLTVYIAGHEIPLMGQEAAMTNERRLVDADVAFEARGSTGLIGLYGGYSLFGPGLFERARRVVSGEGLCRK
jgi:hypothetical protein